MRRALSSSELELEQLRELERSVVAELREVLALPCVRAALTGRRLSADEADELESAGERIERLSATLERAHARHIRGA